MNTLPSTPAGSSLSGSWASMEVSRHYLARRSILAHSHKEQGKDTLPAWVEKSIIEQERGHNLLHSEAIPTNGLLPDRWINGRTLAANGRGTNLSMASNGNKRKAERIKTLWPGDVSAGGSVLSPTIPPMLLTLPAKAGDGSCAGSLKVAKVKGVCRSGVNENASRIHQVYIARSNPGVSRLLPCSPWMMPPRSRTASTLRRAESLTYGQLRRTWQAQGRAATFLSIWLMRLGLVGRVTRSTTRRTAVELGGGSESAEQSAKRGMTRSERIGAPSKAVRYQEPITRGSCGGRMADLRGIL